MIQIRLSLGDALDRVKSRRRAEPEALKLREDKPHPVRPLAPVSYLGERVFIDPLLRLHEAVQVVLIIGAGWIARVCHGLSRVVSFGEMKERTAVSTISENNLRVPRSFEMSAKDLPGYSPNIPIGRDVTPVVTGVGILSRMLLQRKDSRPLFSEKRLASPFFRSTKFLLVRRPAEVDKGQGDAAKWLFFGGGDPGRAPRATRKRRNLRWPHT